MTNSLLNASGLTTPKVTTEEIILRGKPISDAINGGGEFRITSPHSLGDFYFSITSHMPEGVLPLNGSEVSRVTYSDLYDYVLSIHNDLVASGRKFIVSEEEWQNISIENNGYVPYYSYGTGDSLFRLPRMSGYLKATGEVDEAGNYVTEGLPNITGSFQSITNYISDDISVGALYSESVGNKQIGGGGSGKHIKLNIDASRSNPIYGNSEHVTPETNTLFVGVWALVAFTQVGTANLSEIKEILSQCETILGDSLPLLSSRYDNKGLETSAWKLSDGSWLDGRIYTDAYNKILQRVSEGDTVCLEMKESELLASNEFPENFLIDTEGVKFRLPLFVVNERTIIKEWQEGTEWYTIYSDGWIEQGGEVYHNTRETHTVNLLVPFKNTDYNVTKSLGVAGIYTDSASVAYASISNYTTTSFDTRSSNNNGLNRFRWKACGYGEMPPREEWEIDFNYYFKVSHGVDEGRINIEEKLAEFEETAYTRLDKIVEEVSKDYVVHIDKQVGELYFSFNDYFPDGVIPLDGRLVSRATYADLWQWVQEKGLVKDDALITTNDENTVSIFNEDGSIRYCQWYGSGDGSLTFRMPKINGYLGATGDNTLAGQYTAEGLPNITGTLFTGGAESSNVSGAFTTPDELSFIAYGTGGGYINQDISTVFDASLSNPIYGNSENVTPETNMLFVGVWAITATKAAVFDMRDVEEALKSAESYLMNNVPLMSSRWDRDGLGNLGWVKADGSWVDGRHYTGAYNYCVQKLVSGYEDFIDGQVSTITEENFDKFIVDRINKRFRLPITNGQRTWEEVQGLNNPDWVLYFKLAHEFYAPAQAEIQEKLDLIDNLVVKTDINLPTLSSRWDSDFAENVGWVKSEGQWLNGNVYRDAYELMVSRIGINDKFIESTVGAELTDENADKFLIDTAAVKFRLPLINGERIPVISFITNSTYANANATEVSNGNKSYVIYSDGWCEQNIAVWPGYNGQVITLLTPYKNKCYNIVAAQSESSNTTDTAGVGATVAVCGEMNKTTTSFRISKLSTDTVYLQTVGYVNIPAPADYNRNTYLYFKLADEVPSTIVDTQELIDALHEEAINFKNECSQTLAQGDFVIETWRDGYNWYRLYRSGWIEQGGRGGQSSTTYKVILHKEMADNLYHINLTAYDYNNVCYNIVCNNRTTTDFEIYGGGDGAKAVTKMWEVKGFIKTN